MKKIILILFTTVIIFQLPVVSQENSVYPQPVTLVTVPTAGIIPRGA